MLKYSTFCSRSRSAKDSFGASRNTVGRWFEGFGRFFAIRRPMATVVPTWISFWQGRQGRTQGNRQEGIRPNSIRPLIQTYRYAIANENSHLCLLSGLPTIGTISMFSKIHGDIHGKINSASALICTRAGKFRITATLRHDNDILGRRRIRTNTCTSRRDG